MSTVEVTTGSVQSAYVLRLNSADRAKDRRRVWEGAAPHGSEMAEAHREGAMWPAPDRLILIS
jgi:hypothetical protein